MINKYIPYSQVIEMYFVFLKDNEMIYDIKPGSVIGIDDPDDIISIWVSCDSGYAIMGLTTA